MLKTMAGWNESRQDLGKYLAVGDAVDNELMEYFLNVLPPACFRSNLIQIGEPNDHVNGRATYSTLYKPAGAANWLYAGHCHRGEWTESNNDMICLCGAPMRGGVCSVAGCVCSVTKNKKLK